MPIEGNYQARYIRVPFTEKDRAKALGARWDAELKCWFVLDLSRFSAAPGAHLSGDPFKSQGAFPA